MSELCPEERLQALMMAMQDNADDELQQADGLVADYPEDPRLHFLRGSLLASMGRPIEAMPALKKAVELAPDFALARFQLGFFQLTSGEATDALSTWGPLALLPVDHYLRMFVAGLTYLIRDEFEPALEQLRAGIAANEENPPLNRDMHLLAEQIERLKTHEAGAEVDASGSASATSMLLNQFGSRTLN